MALIYQELFNRVQLLLDRDDVIQIAENGEEVNIIDQFIANAEKRYYRSAAARIPPMERYMNFDLLSVPGVTRISIPPDYFEMRFITASAKGQQVTLKRTSPESILNTTLGSYTVNIPTTFAYGNNEWLIPSSSEVIALSINYYGCLPELKSVIDPDTNNWLLRNLDDLIAYWAAVEGSLYFGDIDPTQTQLWEAKAQSIHDDVVEQEIRQRESGSTPRQGRPYKSIRSRAGFGYRF